MRLRVAIGVLLAGNSASVAVRVCVLPLRFTVSVTVSPGLSVPSTLPSVVLPLSVVPLTAVITSPACTPAFSAGVPGWTWLTDAPLVVLRPSTLTPR